jgi:photosystem II stability/assembly factor-like uncharacterized protein
MQQLMRLARVRGRSWLVLLAGATLVAACSGGGGDAPAPSPLPDQLLLRSAGADDIAQPSRFASNLSPATGLSFNWDFGDASSSQAAEPSHQYARPGDYEVQLTVRSSTGETRTARLPVRVNNRAQVQGLQCAGPGQSGWCWLAPQPTGHEIYRVFWLDAQRAWRVGEAGTLFRSQDGGQSWQRLDSGVAVPLFDVAFSDAQHGWALGAEGALLRTVDGGLNWQVSKLPEGDYNMPRLRPPRAGLLQIETSGRQWTSRDGGLSWTVGRHELAAWLPDDSRWTLANGELKVSRDGGLNFETALRLPEEHASLQWRLSHAPGPHLMLSGFRAQFDAASGGRSVELRTWVSVDAGRHWAPQSFQTLLPLNGPLELVQAAPDGQRLLALQGPILVQSADGGRSWSWASRQRDSGLPALQADGRVSVIDFGQIWLTGDLGQSWQSVPLPALNRVPGARTLRVLGPRQFYLESEEQGFVSTDDGASWRQVLALQPGPGLQSHTESSVSFAPGGVGLRFGSEGALERTRDAGRSWLPVAAPWPYGTQVQMLDAQRAWFLDLNGVLQASPDGGSTWRPLAAPGRPWTVFRFATRELGWARDAEGRLHVTQDGGLLWRSLALPPGCSDVGFEAAAWLAVCSRGSAYRSTDGGQRWQELFTGSTDTLRKVKALGGGRWLVLGDQQMLRTDDGGQRWSVQTLSQAGLLADLDCPDAQRCWVVGWQGQAYASQDGGISWRAQRTDTRVNLVRVQFVDTKTGWIHGDNGTVLATGTGGQ